MRVSRLIGLYDLHESILEIHQGSEIQDNGKEALVLSLNVHNL